MQCKNVLEPPPLCCFSHQVRAGTVFSGEQLDGMDERLLVRLVQEATVFYRVSPRHKLRIVKVGVVGYIADTTT